MEEKLFLQINDDIKTAMKQRDKIALETLRGVKKEFLEAKTAKGADGTLSDDKAIKIMQKMVKQRRETAEVYASQNRPELAEKELSEAEVIAKYLPQQMSEAEIETFLKSLIEELGVTNMQGMGKVMGVATKKLSGKADGKIISIKVKQLLGN